MSSNVTQSEKDSGSENAISTETKSKISFDVRTDKKNFNGKCDESISSDVYTITTNDITKIKNIDGSTDELQEPDGNCITSEHSSNAYGLEKSKSGSKLSDRVKRKSWYNAIYPSYKTRSETFKKLFKDDVPDDQRLIVDYSCALQREILVHGRMYVSQSYMCFHANIFGWETALCIKWRNVTALTKEKTAIVIPNAILISTKTEKYFITSFAARDKSYLMLFRIWQNALLNKSMLPQEVWQCVHSSYGDELGLTSDDEDYIDPKDEKPTNENELWTESEENVTEQNLSVKSNCEILNIIETEMNNSCNVKMMRGHNEIEHNTLSANSTMLRSAQSKLRMRQDLGASDIPTDVSNTTDSEDENSVPFECTAECTSMHEGRQLVHTILPINVDSLLTMLFSKSKFFAEFHHTRNTTNMVYRDWIDNDDGTKIRTINFTVAVTQPVGPKTSNMTEVQIMRDCSAPGQLYSIDIISKNAGIPYADSFHISSHYCLVRTVDDHTMLSVYVQIKYTKTVWGVIKGFIEKNAWCGLENFYKDLIKALQSEYCIPPAKSKSRRNKRALSQKLSIGEDMSKRSSLKPTTKTTAIEQLTIPQTSFNPLNRNLMGTQIPTEIIPDRGNSRRFFTFNMFSIFVVILIITLVLLNIYLLMQLYALKHKYTEIDRQLVDKLTASSDINEMKENWLHLLGEQKMIHEIELKKWQSFVKTAVNLLENIKEIYSKFNKDLKNVNESIKDEL